MCLYLMLRYLRQGEGFGLVIPEYMLAKRPIVAFSVDAIPELIINGETGILVERENVEQMADAIIKLHNCPQIMDKLTRKAYQTAVDKYNLNRVVEEHERLFDGIVNQ